MAPDPEICIPAVWGRNQSRQLLSPLGSEGRAECPSVVGTRTRDPWRGDEARVEVWMSCGQLPTQSVLFHQPAHQGQYGAPYDAIFITIYVDVLTSL